MTFNETDINRDTIGRFSDKVGSAPDVSLSYTDSQGNPTEGVSEARAAAIFEDIMEEHGLIEDGWKFDFDRATGRVGLCSYRAKTIYLSRPLLHALSAEQVRQTALHEVAHAKTEGHGHGRVWAAYARAIGYTGGRCADQNEAIARVQAAKRVTKEVAYSPNGTPVYKGDTFDHKAKTYTVLDLRRKNALVIDNNNGDQMLANLGLIGKALREKDGRPIDASRIVSKDYPAERMTLTVGDKLLHRHYGEMTVDDLNPKTIVLAATNGLLYAYTPRSVSRMERVHS